jgi:hypothetical protein
MDDNQPTIEDALVRFVASETSVLSKASNFCNMVMVHNNLISRKTHEVIHTNHHFRVGDSVLLNPCVL